jgi:hypothetical protein
MEICVCVACSLLPIAARLQWDLAAATERADAAKAVFKGLTCAIPNDLPHPDGTQRMQTASHELKVARRALMAATLRLSDYLNHGTIPDDLKR